MNQELFSKLEKSIENLKSNNSKIYFIVQDTKGNAKASISYIYRMAKALQESGLKPVMLHETPNYTGVGEWLGEEYAELPHQSIQGQPFEVSPEDFIVIPELYAFVMDQIKQLPCGKIVLSQSHDSIFETLEPGQTWQQFGFHKCITTSEKQKEFITGTFRNLSVDVVEPVIPDHFKPYDKFAKPFVAIHSKEQRDSINIIKQFYIKFPQYRWITFKDMRGLTEKEFATALQDCCLSVWIDDNSSYGTYPLESMKSNVPVLGLVPNLVPEWMTETNGVWVNNKNQLVDYVADFLQNWLEDNVNEELETEMLKTTENLQTTENFEKQAVTLFEGYIKTRLTSFEEQLPKLNTIEE